MRKLQELRLQHTGVEGALDDLTDLEDLEATWLTSTRLTGSLTPAWRGKLRHLRHLYLAAWALVVRSCFALVLLLVLICSGQPGPLFTPWGASCRPRAPVDHVGQGAAAGPGRAGRNLASIMSQLLLTPVSARHLPQYVLQKLDSSKGLWLPCRRQGWGPPSGACRLQGAS